MRTTTKSITALLSAGLVVAALAGCSEPAASTGGSSSSTGTSSSAAASETPSAAPTPAAMLSTVSGKTTAITLDAGFVKALGTLKLTPGTIGSATLSKAGVLTFPITGGNVTYYDPATKVRPYVQGELDHKGSGLSLSAGGKKVELKDFVIDPGNNSHVSGDVYLNGKSVVKGANLFRLDGSTLMPVTQDADKNFILEGTTVYISKDAAALLNSTFKTTAVTDQLKVGVAKLTVK